MPEPNFEEFTIRCEMTEDRLIGKSDDPNDDNVSLVYKLAICLVILGRRMPKSWREDLLAILLSNLKSWEVDKDGDSHEEGDG